MISGIYVDAQLLILFLQRVVLVAFSKFLRTLHFVLIEIECRLWYIDNNNRQEEVSKTVEKNKIKPDTIRPLFVFFIQNARSKSPNVAVALDKYGNFSFSPNPNIPAKLLDITDQIAPIVVSDLITEYIGGLSVSLKFDSNTRSYHTIWNVDSLFIGMLFELSILCSQDMLARKCANHNCGYFFLPHYPNHKFCCDSCR